MKLDFHSPVIITDNISKLQAFYENVLNLPVELNFGTCIILKCGLSLWQLNKEQLISKKLGYTHHKHGNKNLELSFETDNFEEAVAGLKTNSPNLLHDVNIESWGQQTIRFFDPENNLIEIGETIPCFVKRLYSEGLTVEQVAVKTSVPKDLVREYIEE